MSSTLPDGYMADRVYEESNPSALEQQNIDAAIAASLAIRLSFYQGTSPTLAHTDENWSINYDLDKALHASIEGARNDEIEASVPQEATSSTPEGLKATQPSTQKGPNLTKMVQDMAIRLATEPPLLNVADADTLVFM